MKFKNFINIIENKLNFSINFCIKLYKDLSNFAFQCKHLLKLYF